MTRGLAASKPGCGGAGNSRTDERLSFWWVGTLQSNLEKLLEGDGIPQALAECSALDVLHDEEDLAPMLDDVVDGGDVRVVERRGSLGLFQEPAAIGFRELKLRGHALDGHAAAEDRA